MNFSVKLSAHLNANARLLFKQMRYLISRSGECIKGLSNEISDSIPRERSHLMTRRRVGKMGLLGSYTHTSVSAHTH